ncbi:hypothetical protein FA15DRAFT_709192 [Coprinopsis marcescibilis]|uniref:Uncharacterized protein n=1 Tax=Coprinopsis marcescibilis TaxID=230819 RepID=A0A5C3KGQ1_COPMA|nr:hypothetical protein FA15DRAFT_709192 [Coprinopsis marcescibilis]
MTAPPSKRPRIDSQSELSCELHTVDQDSFQALHKLVWGKHIREFLTEVSIVVPRPPIKHPTPTFSPTSEEEDSLDPTELNFTFIKTGCFPLPMDLLNNLPDYNGPTLLHNLPNYNGPAPALLIRDEYEELFNDLTLTTFHSKARNFVVTGQAGIGKSTGLVYILLRLLSRQARVAYQDETMAIADQFHFYDETGYHFLQTESEFVQAVRRQGNSPIYRLVDVGQKPITTAARMPNERHVYVCTPTHVNWSHTIKIQHKTSSMWYMKPFSWPELYALFKFYNPTDDTPSPTHNIWNSADLLLGHDDTVTDQAFENGGMSPQQRFEFLHILFGGSARNCFASSPRSEIGKLHAAINQITLRPESFEQAWSHATTPCGDGSEQLRMDATHVIIPWPHHSARHVATYFMASIHIVKKLAVKNQNAIWHSISKQYSAYTQSPDFSVAAGLMFEHLMHRYFLTPTFCEIVHDLFTFGSPRRKISIQFNFTEAIRFDSCNIIKDENKYYRPLIWNFPGFDSCAIINNELYLFQMTINKGDHPFNADCLERFKGCQLHEMKTNLVFVMPKGKDQFARQRSCRGKIDSHVRFAKTMITQYLLEIPVNQVFENLPASPTIRI